MPERECRQAATDAKRRAGDRKRQAAEAEAAAKAEKAEKAEKAANATTRRDARKVGAA
jgi:hypothetical protein